jgi:hypothetical protein
MLDEKEFPHIEEEEDFLSADNNMKGFNASSYIGGSVIKSDIAYDTSFCSRKDVVLI